MFNVWSLARDVGRPGSLLELFVYVAALRNKAVLYISRAKHDSCPAQLVISARSIGGDRFTFSLRLACHTIDSRIGFHCNREGLCIHISIH